MATSRTPVLPIPQVAVVTVSYGSESVLGAFLSSLPEAASTRLRIVVADNKPQDRPNVIENLTAKAGGEYRPLESNRGYGHAINAVVQSLPPEIEWVIVSNPDVVARPGSIDILLDAARSDEKVAAVGPCILSADGAVYPSARSVPSLRSGVGHALFANLWPANPWTRRYRRESKTDPIRRNAGWLSGAFLVVRRSVLDQLNGFDESYFMYFEDVDLGYRIGQLGLYNVYEPKSVVIHTGAHSTQGDESARMIRAHHESAKRFLFKKYSGPLLLPVRVILSIGLGARARTEQLRKSHR